MQCLDAKESIYDLGDKVVLLQEKSKGNNTFYTTRNITLNGTRLLVWNITRDCWK